VIRVLQRRRQPPQRQSTVKKRRRRRRPSAGNPFIITEASEDDDDDDDDDDDEDEEEDEEDSVLQQQARRHVPSAAVHTLSEDRRFSGFLACEGLLCDALVVADKQWRRQSHHQQAHTDHTYARRPLPGSLPSIVAARWHGTPSSATQLPSKFESGEYEERYTFLWAVVTDGTTKRIFNTLPRAVAVLSNSKRLFLGHVSTMFRCLDPALAELCYIDTDSCVWSQTHADLADCLRPDATRAWQQASIMADETAVNSCHGKLKLEGLFAGGFFKTMKIYRLFSASASSAAVVEDANDDNNEGTAGSWCVAYTRCKGIARWAADRLSDAQFDPAEPASRGPHRRSVHRNCLRPSRTGEIRLYHESRSLALPFNYKRWVSPDGVHTLAFGLPQDVYARNMGDGE